MDDVRIRELAEMAVNNYQAGLNLEEAIRQVLVLALEEGLLYED